MKRCLVIAFLLLAHGVSLAVIPAPVIVKEFPASADIGLQPRYPTAVGDTLYFVVGEGTAPDQIAWLWKTDGSEAGTTRVKSGRFLRGLTRANDQVFFTGVDPQGIALWRSDGTEPGTVRLTDPLTGPVPLYEGLAGTDHALFFAASSPDPASGIQIWTTNGQPGDALRLADLGHVFQPLLVTVGDTLVFNADGSTTELWKSDGTPAGTVRINVDPLGDPVRSMVSAGGGVYYARCRSGRCTLWWSDLTSEGTIELTHFVADDVTDDEWVLHELVAAGRNVFFVALGDTGLRELWTSDGTPSGTVRLTGDNGPFLPRSSGLGSAAITNTLYFPAFDGTLTDVKLWRSDATPAGTVMFSGIRQFAGLEAVDTRLFFFLDGAAADEFWTSDGTADGTMRIADVRLRSPLELVEAGGNLFFTANRSESDRQLWVVKLVPPCSLDACEGDARCSMPACTHERCVTSAVVHATRSWCACERASAACGGGRPRGLGARLRRGCSSLEAVLDASGEKRIRRLAHAGARRVAKAVAYATRRGAAADCLDALHDATTVR